MIYVYFDYLNYVILNVIIFQLNLVFIIKLFYNFCRYIKRG